MELYTYFQSSASYRVRIALNLKRLTPEMHFIDLTKGEQRGETYAAINPARVVPTLIDDGQPLGQSLAIMEYLDEAYTDGASLLPKGALARAHTRALALTVAADIAPLGNLKVRKYLSEKLGQSEEATVEFIKHWIKDGLQALELILATSTYTGKFCVGDWPTMADCCLIPQLFNARRWKLDLTPYPTINRIAAACETHHAFVAAHPSKQPDFK